MVLLELCAKYLLKPLVTGRKFYSMYEESRILKAVSYWPKMSQYVCEESRIKPLVPGLKFHSMYEKSPELSRKLLA